MSSVSPFKTSKPKNKIQQPKNIAFFLHSKDDVWRGVCFSPQKHKLLFQIKSDENQGVVKKI